MASPGIGQLNEKPLHAALKQWYAQPGDRFEVPVGKFVIDIVRGDQLIEIQTGSFTPLKSKLAGLLGSHRVRLIYPIVQEKWIARPATPEGGPAIRRKSPKRGRWEDLFLELVSIPQWLVHPNFSLEVLMINAEEARRYEEGRNWRRRGWGVEERRLLEVVDRRAFDSASDWRALVPAGLESFTTNDIAAAMGIQAHVAQKMAYCLRNANLIELIGKRGRGRLYRPLEPAAS
jgi:hypothetical protein